MATIPAPVGRTIGRPKGWRSSNYAPLAVGHWSKLPESSAATIASWGKRLDDHGLPALLQCPGPVNRFPDYVRAAVQRLQALCPRLGKVKIAQILAGPACIWLSAVWAASAGNSRSVHPRRDACK